MTFRNALTNHLADFLTTIGIELVAMRLGSESFLPGIMVKNGRLLVDEDRLTYPVDLLHEAGHLAVASGDVRPGLSGEVLIPGEDMNAVEVAVTAWAYAAVRHLELDPALLFHDGGYRGKSVGLIRTYGFGVYPGAAHLEAIGLTATGERARAQGVAPYPHMLKWVRD